MKNNIISLVLNGGFCLIAGAALLLPGGCAKEAVLGPADDGEVSLLLRPRFAERIVVKSVGGQIEENKIVNLWAIQLDADGNVVKDDGASLIRQYPYSDSDGKGDIADAADGNGASINIRLDPSTAKVCFIANTAVNYSDVTTLADIEKKSATVAAESNLVYESSYLPMSGIYDVSAGGSNEVIMYRAVAKLDLTLAFNPVTTDDKFALSSIQVMQVPDVLHPFRDNASLSQTPYPTLSKTIDYTAVLYDDTSDDSKDLAEVWDAAYMPVDECYGKPVDGAGSPFSWYLPENARGTGTAQNQWEKTADTAPDGQSDYCTYLEIKGYYMAEGLVEEVVYHVYLGGNNTDDYNILRNHNYKLTATIKDKSLVDIRVDEYTPVNYIDYTDNDSPWFVAAPRSDGSVNWQNPDPQYAGLGWVTPTKKQMMLAYVYNPTKVFGESICWVDEMLADNSGRWSVNMDTGGVLPAGGEGSQDYVLRAVKPYGGSDEYPKVVDGNIVISRDENGGVKSEYVRDIETEYWNQTPQHTQAESMNKVASKFEVRPFTTEDGQWIRRSWNESFDYCSGITEDGGNWRMPTQRELMLLYVINDELAPDYQLRTGSEDGFTTGEHPETGKHIYYWSGTEDSTVEEVSSTAWSICFCEDEAAGSFPGKVEGYDKGTQNFVRCVRDAT